MSAHSTGSNVGQAWLQALELLLAAPTDGIVNMTTTIVDPTIEDRGVRRALDRGVAELAATAPNRGKPQSVHTVANTIFPMSLYRRGRTERFFENVEKGQIGRGGKVTSWQPSGTYIGRLVRYPMVGGGTVNQLAVVLERLSNGNAKDRYELSLEVPGFDEGDAMSAGGSGGGGASLFIPGFDNQARGGQCLSHLSVTLLDSRLSMAAVYRHQVYISRAYGNFLGLARLLTFLAWESGHEVGELLIVASHADIDASRAQARGIRDQAAAVAGDDVVDIEVESRLPGAAWRDLDLPVVT
jgi:hypothetical protein